MSLLFLLPSCAIAQDWSARALGEIAIYPEFRAPATVVAVEEARIAAEVGARIVAMPARTGVALARDAELVRLDDAAFRIELDRARAQVALIDSRIGLARAQLDQARALAGRGSSAPTACASARRSSACCSASAMRRVPPRPRPSSRSRVP